MESGQWPPTFTGQPTATAGATTSPAWVTNMTVTIDIWTLAAVMATAATAILLLAVIIEAARRKRARRQMMMQPLLGVVLPRQRKRRASYIAPRKKGRHAK